LSNIGASLDVILHEIFHGIIPPNVVLLFLQHSDKVSLQLRQIAFVTLIYFFGLINHIGVHIARLGFLSGVRTSNEVLHCAKAQSLSLPILVQLLHPIFHFVA